MKLFDIINKETNTFDRTPEPSEHYNELDSMYLRGVWFILGWS
jgi:hypothetical protein